MRQAAAVIADFGEAQDRRAELVAALCEHARMDILPFLFGSHALGLAAFRARHPDQAPVRRPAPASGRMVCR